MYLGALGQQGSTFTVLSQRGERPNCPVGSQEQSRHGSGIRESVTCYRAPVFAAPPTTTVTYHAPITSVAVPTAISTQVSPQISPVMAQQQASPGATVAASPVSAPGPVSTGITGEDLERILAARQAADDAEREARERQDAIEIETLRREMAARTRTMDEIEAARRADDARRIDAERYAREQAEASAQESAGAIPPPPSMTYAPSGGGMLPAMAPPSLPDAFAPSTVDVTQAPVEAGTPWALILMAAAGIGVVVLAGGKGKRKTRVKK
jgi:hypothetical protein